jgi:Zn-dependent protease with chaperone function/Zn-finger nucleic acid-binding protein
VLFGYHSRKPGMDRKRPRDFYEIQKRQWQRSIFLFAVLTLFYFLAVGIIVLAVYLSVGWLAVPSFFSTPFFTRLLAGVLGAAVLIAVFQFYDARKFGAAYILKRLEARDPDLSDRYHKQLADTVEEMRVASGLPRVRPYVVPSFAINSMALVEADGTPALAVTEGLLADCTRDEMQAVAAHELAHISRGDAFYVTLVCSLANFLEKLRAALEPEDIPAEDRADGGRGGAPPILIYGALTMTSLVMHLLSTLLSREREILADAAASEIGRSPVALARALYKSHLKSSFVGDFSLTYSPLFIVAPALSSDEEEGFWSRLFNSHPPLMKRIKILAQQAGLRPAQVIEQVWESQKMREEAKGVIRSFAEIRAVSALDENSVSIAVPQQPKVWQIQDTDGKWQGPFGLEELVFLPYFSVVRRVRNGQEGVEAAAREFPQVRLGLRNLGKKRPLDLSRQNHCPRCRTPLSETYYEGVPVQVCGRCGGKLVASSHMDRIILRREVAFSEALLVKAREFRQQFLLNPVKKQRAKEKEAENIYCPGCGQRLRARPYSYQYFIPVDKCLSCYKIWFDADELELLQILIEKRA